MYTIDKQVVQYSVEPVCSGVQVNFQCTLILSKDYEEQKTPK